MSDVPEMQVRPMTPEEFAAWQGTAVGEYATEVSAARGIGLDDARTIAEQSHRRLLPEGLDSPGVHLVVGEDAKGDRVGILWVGPNPDGVGPVWIYNIEVDRGRRGEGWGRALMAEAERLTRNDGYTEIGLNVFGSNAVARSLYESLGYSAASIQMRNSL